MDVLEVRLIEVPLKTLTKIRMRAKGKPPARVWVWTYLVSPDKIPTASWAAVPVQIDEPFADGPTTTITVESICYFCGIPFEPGTDFYARTLVSTVSNDDSFLRPEYRDRTKKGAIKVVLGAESTNPFEPYTKNIGKTAYNKANGVKIGPIEDVGYSDIAGEGTVIVYKIRYQGELRDMPVDDVVAR